MSNLLHKELKALMQGQAVNAGGFTWGKNSYKGVKTKNAHTFLGLQTSNPDLGVILDLAQNLLVAYGYKLDRRATELPGTSLTRKTELNVDTTEQTGGAYTETDAINARRAWTRNGYTISSDGDALWSLERDSDNNVFYTLASSKNVPTGTWSSEDTPYAHSDGVNDSLINADLSSLGQINRVVASGWVRSPTATRIYFSLNDIGTGQIYVDIDTPNTWQYFSEIITFVTMNQVALGKLYAFGLTSFYEADWAKLSLTDTTFGSPPTLLAQWDLSEKTAGALNGVTAVDSLGNFNGVHQGGTAGVTSDINTTVNVESQSFDIDTYIASALGSVKNDTETVKLMLESGKLEQFNNATDDRERLAAVFATLAQ